MKGRNTIPLFEPESPQETQVKAQKPNTIERPKHLPIKQTISILPPCTCTHKPYPHSHENDIGLIPWNWNETHAIWAEKKKQSRRVQVVNGKLERV